MRTTHLSCPVSWLRELRFWRERGERGLEDGGVHTDTTRPDVFCAVTVSDLTMLERQKGPIFISTWPPPLQLLEELSDRPSAVSCQALPGFSGAPHHIWPQLGSRKDYASAKHELFHSCFTGKKKWKRKRNRKAL